MEKNRCVVELKDVSIYHTDGNSRGPKSDDELVLSDVNLSVAEGEMVYFIGRVGSGKSTLLKTLYAEVQLLEGQGRVVGVDLRKVKRSDIPHLRRKMGIVFQDYQLLDDRNVFYNLYDVMKATGWKNEADIRRRIDEVLTIVGLDNKAYKMPFELSGGEQQRIVIARAILNKPALILADEPTGNLDNETGNYIMKLLHGICREEKSAVLMITHNEQWLTQYPGTEYRLSAGKMQLIKSASNPQEAAATAPETMEN